MGKQDWFRKTTWSVKEKTQFYERLNRSRTDYNKAQYLRIQASHLQTAKPPYYEEAIELIDYLLQYYPHISQLAGAYMQKAQCLEALGNISDAKDAYLLSLIAEETSSGVKTTAPLEFAMFVIRHSLKELYDKVFHTLIQDNIKMLTLFPARHYQACAALAIIADETGNKDEARKFAQKALDSAKVKDTGLRYHPKIGLVHNQNRKLQRKLEKIAHD
ncbi:hypothetical protein MNBD_CHLOROFLEXI01-786 [hydrothermal vent metagenome]|uniref:Tetratricopeptide repeat protein n=1 Tax=hydrothermal vent metagenome TaxID=652676 RepID=A0A3B0VY00_9ZZZZ